MNRDAMIATLTLLGWEPLHDKGYAALLICRGRTMDYPDGTQAVDCIWAWVGVTGGVRADREYQRQVLAWAAGSWSDIKSEVLMAVLKKAMS